MRLCTVIRSHNTSSVARDVRPLRWQGELHKVNHVAIPPAAAMTTQPLRPPLPPYLQPNAKAPSTARSSNLSALASGTPSSSRSSSQARPVKQRQNASKVDFTSETATLSLIRRVLSPQHGHPTDQRTTPRPIEDLLPPLTSFNEVDVQLYAIIAIVFKDFVYAWYAKITPDHAFVEEVIQIIAHTTRALEQRLRRVDLGDLVLDEIPAVVAAHVQCEVVIYAEINRPNPRLQHTRLHMRPFPPQSTERVPGRHTMH